MADRLANRWDNLDPFGLETPYSRDTLLEAEAEWHLPSEAKYNGADEALDWLSLDRQDFGAGQVAWEDYAGNGAGSVRSSASGGQFWTIRDHVSKTRIAIFVPPAARDQSQIDVLVYSHGLLGNDGPPQRGAEALVESKTFQLAATVVASGRPIVLVVPLFQTGDNKSWSARGFDRPSGLNRLVTAVLNEVGAKAGSTVPNLSALFVAGHSRGYGILYPLIRALAKSPDPASLVPRLSEIWMLDASYPRYGRGFPDTQIAQLATTLPRLKIRIAYLKNTATDPHAAGFSAVGAELLPLTAGRRLQHSNVPARALSKYLGNGAAAQSAVQTGQEAMAYHDRISGDFEDHMAGMDEDLAWEADENNFEESEEEFFTNIESSFSLEESNETEMLADQFGPDFEHECETEQDEWSNSFEADEELEYDNEGEESELEDEQSTLSLLLGQGEDVAMGSFDWLQGTYAFLLGPTLQRGSAGPGVAFLQRLMQRLGQTVSMDMKFGPGTQRAVQALQRSFGLNPTGDADVPTKAAFMKALATQTSAQPVPAPSTIGGAQPAPAAPTTSGARLTETPGGIRKLPISARLRELLIGAANDAGVDQVHVYSGGQIAKGAAGAIEGKNRTGSTRHDSGMAADLQLKKNGRVLDFGLPADLPYFEGFVTAAARRGATGIGAAEGYMGSNRIHVGFGLPALVWGAGGKSANAPAWLKAAFAKGQSQPGNSPATTRQTNPPSPNGPQLTREQLIRIMPGSQDHVDRYVGPLNEAMNRHAIHTVAQKAALLGQIAIESGNLRTVSENLNYSAQRLAVVWPSRFSDPEVARRYANNPERLGNFVYANRLGNGNVASGDGFRYRGRGLIQLTGRLNYRAAGFEANPEALLDPATAAETAGSFWARRGLNARTQQPLNRARYRDVTVSVNGAARSEHERWTVYQRALAVLGNQ